MIVGWGPACLGREALVTFVKMEAESELRLVC